MSEPTLNRIVAFVATHRSVPPDQIKRFANVPSRQIVRALMRMPGVSGCVALVTCHRSELYVSTPTPAQVGARIPAFFQAPAFRGIVKDAPEEFRPASKLATLADLAAVEHLFRVAAGADSLIVGEHEVLGQVRAALRIATEEKSVDPLLRRAWQRAIDVGRRARQLTDYEIPRDAYAAEAASSLRRRLRTLERRRILVVGAGALGTQVARRLQRERVDLFVTNRTAETGRRLARRSGAEFVPLASASQLAPTMSAVVIAAPLDGIPFNAKPSARRPLVVDLANVLSNGRRRGDVTLQQIVGRLAKEAPRRKALHVVDAFVQEKARQFLRVRPKAASAETVIRRINADAAALAARELHVLFKRLPGLSDPDQEVVRDFARSLHTKLVLAPTLALKEAERLRRHDLLEAARRLFAPPRTGKVDAR